MLGLVAALAFAAYLFQVASPLRIENDSTEYLVLASYVADGHGFPAGASFPPGMPFLIAGLDAIGAARSWGFVLVNAAFLALGLGAWARIVRRELGYSLEGVLVVTIACLLAVPMIRFASHPLSEAVFFGISLLGLALAVEARSRRSIALLVAAAVAMGLAIAVRTFGIALAPALLPPLLAIVRTRAQRIAVVVFAAVVGVLAFLTLSPTRYVDEAVSQWGDDPLRVAAVHGRDLLRGFAELVVNIPLDRAPAVADWIYPVIGFVVVVVVAVGARALWRRSPVVVTYLASAAALLAAWPLDTSRLILPVFPLLVVCVIAAVAPLGRHGRIALRTWAAGFAVVGVVAIVGVTRVSYSGDHFPERYSSDNAAMQATYRVAFGTATAADETIVLPRALWVLRRYDPRATGDPGPLPPVNATDEAAPRPAPAARLAAAGDGDAAPAPG